MRRLFGTFTAWVVGSSALACGDLERARVEARPAEEPLERPPAVPSGGGGGESTETIDVAGVFAGVVGARLALVDARGARAEAAPDAEGRFSFVGVTPPYDLAVDRGDRAHVYLGLSRPDPYVAGLEYERAAPVPEPQLLRFAVPASLCHGVSCFVIASAASASGAGHTTVNFPRAEGDVSVDIAHGWRAAPSPTERITLHVLVRDDARGTFGYARSAPVAILSGATIDLGVLDVAAVPATQPVRVGVGAGGGALVDWSWQTTVMLGLPDAQGASNEVLFADVPTPVASMRLPELPHATLRVHVAAAHPRNDPQGGFVRTTRSWSSPSSISEGARVDVIAGPVVRHPTPNGTLARRGVGFSWTDAPARAVSMLTVRDDARGAVRYRVLTSGTELTHTRLAMLGVAPLEPGAHVLDLTTTTARSIDDAVDPDERRRAAVLGGALAEEGGTTSRLRVSFRVTR